MQPSTHAQASLDAPVSPALPSLTTFTPSSADPSSAAALLSGFSPHVPGPRFHLVLPFTVLGVAGGWMAADFFRVGALEHMDAGLRPSLVAIAALASSLLGLLLQPVTRWPGWRATVVATASVLLAGMLAGGFVGVMTWSRYGLGEGAASGFWCGVAFLPGFAAILMAARRLDRARPGSLVHGADRRAVWLAVSAAVAMGTLAALPDWTFIPGMGRPELGVSRWLGVTSVVVIGVLLLSNGVGVIRAHRAAGKLRDMRTCAPNDPSLSWARRQLDLGLGHEAAASVMPSAGIYREHDRIMEVVRGDPARAGQALLGSLGLSAAALACGVACLVATASHSAFAAAAPKRSLSEIPLSGGDVSAAPRSSPR
ncbi:hypothetical protein [Chondromyces crocatus]|uniref:Transmembrane protein n=1 Tax=Chondromyces crocatus TaxID=52 RepID=A0A0K1EKD8_CHOCO|nr:hypothetical protein [Chondromyces crocatus]AKT41329.1 uncharacterized protein CMC5_055280 [Chondromyces crocatus]